MSWLVSILLYFIHAVYSLMNLASSLREYYSARRPLPLATHRTKFPNHVAILFASDSESPLEEFEQRLLQNVEKVVGWCRKAGIQRLTFYDRHGMLSRLSFELRARLVETPDKTDASSSESELEYPLTPPLSDHSPSSSRSLSPKQHVPPKLHVSTLKLDKQMQKRRNSSRGVVKRRTSRKSSSESVESLPLAIHIISRDSGKVAIAEVANTVARERRRSVFRARSEDFSLSVDELKILVEGENGFPSPDLMIVHHMTRYRHPKGVLELFGFPPWHISSTEFYYTSYPRSWWAWDFLKAAPTSRYVPLSETDICRALDQYAGAQMRLGK